MRQALFFLHWFVVTIVDFIVYPWKVGKQIIFKLSGSWARKSSKFGNKTCDKPLMTQDFFYYYYFLTKKIWTELYQSFIYGNKYLLCLTLFCFVFFYCDYGHLQRPKNGNVLFFHVSSCILLKVNDFAWNFGHLFEEDKRGHFRCYFISIRWYIFATGVDLHRNGWQATLKCERLGGDSGVETECSSWRCPS